VVWMTTTVAAACPSVTFWAPNIARMTLQGNTKTTRAHTLTSQGPVTLPRSMMACCMLRTRFASWQTLVPTFVLPDALTTTGRRHHWMSPPSATLLRSHAVVTVPRPVWLPGTPFQRQQLATAGFLSVNARTCTRTGERATAICLHLQVLRTALGIIQLGTACVQPARHSGRTVCLHL
jgi:hypothetical protein